MIWLSRVVLNGSQSALKSAADLASAPVMPASMESSLVLASRTFAFSASWADLSLAFIIEYSAVRALARAAQASLAESAQATETNPNPRPNTTLTAIDRLLAMAKLIEFWTSLVASAIVPPLQSHILL